MLTKLRQTYCRLLHSDISYAGGPIGRCRTCLLPFEAPHVELPVMRMNLPRPVSVRQVAGPKIRRVA